jgi:hypothetical protein
MPTFVHLVLKYSDHNKHHKNSTHLKIEAKLTEHQLSKIVFLTLPNKFMSWCKFGLFNLNSVCVIVQGFYVITKYFIMNIKLTTKSIVQDADGLIGCTSFIL